jgi:hypothetical protein
MHTAEGAAKTPQEAYEIKEAENHIEKTAGF